jgi:hypothetical protein
MNSYILGGIEIMEFLRRGRDCFVRVKAAIER